MQMPSLQQKQETSVSLKYNMWGKAAKEREGQGEAQRDLQGAPSPHRHPQLQISGHSVRAILSKTGDLVIGEDQ